MKSNTYDYSLIGGATDVGLVRKANEDRGLWFDSLNGRIGLVCDGMGGHVGGQIASQTAIESIQEYLGRDYFEDAKEAIKGAIVFANNAILDKAQRQPELKGMGSTCVMLLIRDGKVYYGHVGDSRIYAISNRMIKQLTSDHSFVQLLVDAGQITKEQAERHPRRNEITNALGLQNMQSPTICTVPVEPEAGVCFLLCSDGLTGMVSDRKIEKIVSNRELNLNQRAEKLIDLANEAGGTDNITVQLVEFALGIADIKPDKRKSHKVKLIYSIAIIFSLASLFAIYLFVFHSRSCSVLNENPKTVKSEGTQRKVIEKSLVVMRKDKSYVIETQIPNEITIEPDSVIVELPNGKEDRLDGLRVVNDKLYFNKLPNFLIDSIRIRIRIETDSVSFILSCDVKEVLKGEGNKKSVVKSNKVKVIEEVKAEKDSSIHSIDKTTVVKGVIVEKKGKPKTDTNKHVKSHKSKEAK